MSGESILVTQTIGPLLISAAKWEAEAPHSAYGHTAGIMYAHAQKKIIYE